MNEELLDEYKIILARRKVRPSLIAATISLIRSAAEYVPLTEGRDISPAAFDEPFCSCAEEGNADFIVTPNLRAFPQYKLRAHVISPGDPIPTNSTKAPTIDRCLLVTEKCCRPFQNCAAIENGQ